MCKEWSILVKIVEFLVAKHHSLWLLRTLDDDLDLTAGSRFSLRLWPDMQYNLDICLLGCKSGCT